MVLTPLFCMGTCDMAFHGRMMETRATWPAAATTPLAFVPLRSNPAALVQPTAAYAAHYWPTSHGRSPPHLRGHCFLPLTTKYRGQHPRAFDGCHALSCHHSGPPPPRAKWVACPCAHFF